MNAVHYGECELVDQDIIKLRFEELKKAAFAAINAADSLKALDDIEIEFLGRKGKITAVIREIPSLDVSVRPVFGGLANTVKNGIKDVIERKREEIKKKTLDLSIVHEKVDHTLPGRRVRAGSVHIINQVIGEITEIFLGMGYRIAEGPEVELDYYNFEALNTPEDHPARSLSDTFFVSEKVLLRTHTSPVQIRYMEKHKPPIYIIAPGKVYRRDYDVTHTPMFHQIEGLAVDESIMFTDFKGTLEQFAHQFFGEHVKMRFRPHYFPFTEPSAEVDISCVICSGVGCRVCKNSGWLEILGAGMVHPNLYRYVNYPEDRYNGFAFGMGIERIAMLRYGIDDLRLFFDGDIKFIKQF